MESARIAPLICAARPAGQCRALLMSRHAEASHGKQRRALGRGRRGGRRRGRGRACRGERGGRARGPCRPDREGREPRRQHGVVGRLDHGDGHAAPAPRRDRRQHGRALRGPRACSPAARPIATTSRCAASSSTKHPRRSTGCCRPASSSPGPTPSRRTALRACTTCCRTRAPFRPRSGATAGASASTYVSALRAERLLVEDGRVLGVAARGDDGSTIAFKARGGVVLATGDFSADREMKAEHASATVAKTEPVNALSTGDGHRLALAVGARIVNGDIVHGPRLRFVPPARASLVRRLPPWRVVGLAAKFAAERLPDFSAAPGADGVRHDRARRRGQPLQARRHPREQGGPALCRRARQSAGRAARPARGHRLCHPRRRHRRGLLALAQLRLDRARRRLRLHRRLPPQPPRRLPRGALARRRWRRRSAFPADGSPAPSPKATRRPQPSAVRR